MNVIELKGLTYKYSVGTPFESTAVDNVDLTIEKGEFCGIIGHTGSGKSTLIQHLNGLVKPTSGEVLIDGRNIWSKGVDIRSIRFKVGLVFQYSEYQLFEETVYKDIAYGPKNMGCDEAEIDRRVREAAENMGIREELLERSPFDLSGGQKRRVALAGVIAMDPEILILDEPAAGLDPIGREKVLGKISDYHKKYGKTILLVSHSMEDIVKYADKVLVMNKGKLFCHEDTDSVFARQDEIIKIGLDVPQITKIMMTIPNIIDPSVPIGKDDSENVEITRYGEPVVPDFEVPYHTDIMERLNGIDLDSARKVAGNGFYYLMGDIARLHSAVLAYARDFMINRGFTYCVPPFMIRSNVVTGVMSFAEMDAMMYKIEGEDLYLIGTSEHSMIGKFIDTIVPEAELPKTLTSYSPCFRKEKGAHGLEERGVYRIHQFEKQEMIVVCKPEDSAMWFDKLWQNTVDLFRSMDIPVRTIECCSGDLADLKVKSYDVEAWSPRQKKYFEVGSCSNLGDAQARRLKIRVNGEKGKYFAHTLNNTVVAPPRMLIAFLENNLQADGSIRIPEVLRPYMGGMTEIR